MSLNSKKRFFKKIYLILIVVMSIILFNFIIDPFQQYRLPEIYKIGNLREEERYLNAGLLRNKNYDTVLIGSSITRNFEEEYIKKILDWNVIKLTMSSANQGEIKFVLDHIDSLKTKNIIISIDLGAFNKINLDEIPKYLYKQKLTLKDDFTYLTNIGVLKQSIKLVFYNLRYKKVEEKFKLGYHYKYSKEEFFRKEKIKKISLNHKLNLDNCSLEMLENYNKTLKIILDKNKNKNIILFFPPYSIVAYKNMFDNPKELQEYLAFKKFLVNESLKYKNIKIYDFQDIKEITHNFENYGDKLHYSPEVCRKLINYIAKDEYRITPENVLKRIENLETQILN